MNLYENKTGRTVPIKVTLPSGRKVRVELPEGQFELPAAYQAALRAIPQGAKLLKEMTVKKPRKKASKTAPKPPSKPKVETDEKLIEDSPQS